jgi:hypothetical protein
MKLSFTEHPASVGESYLQHLRQAGRFAIGMIGAGLACLVHAILPFLFIQTGSSMVSGLYGRMVAHRARTVPINGFSGAADSNRVGVA